MFGLLAASGGFGRGASAGSSDRRRPPVAVVVERLDGRRLLSATHVATETDDSYVFSGEYAEGDGTVSYASTQTGSTASSAVLTPSGNTNERVNVTRVTSDATVVAADGVVTSQRLDSAGQDASGSHLNHNGGEAFYNRGSGSGTGVSETTVTGADGVTYVAGTEATSSTSRQAEHGGTTPGGTSHYAQDTVYTYELTTTADGVTTSVSNAGAFHAGGTTDPNGGSVFHSVGRSTSGVDGEATTTRTVIVTVVKNGETRVDRAA